MRNCTINGYLRIYGDWVNEHADGMRAASRTSTYVADLRAAAPTGVLVEDVTIIANGPTPLRIGPGVTGATLRRITLNGDSDSVMVYFFAESSRNVLEDCDIDARSASREAIAIDSSDQNVVRGCTIRHRRGGMRLYRNCGEGGTVRHTTPSWNVIEDNIFFDDGPYVAIWLGSRDGRRCYCDEDNGGRYGSARSDMDHARYNWVRRNDLGGSRVREGASCKGNVIEDNLTSAFGLQSRFSSPRAGVVVPPNEWPDPSDE